MAEEVKDWLHSHNFGEYTDKFIEQGYDQMMDFEAMSESDAVELCSLVGITKLGHRKRFLFQVKGLQSCTANPPQVSQLQEVTKENTNSTCKYYPCM